MSIFGKKKPEVPATPPRRDKVVKAIKADMDFEKAIDRDACGGAFSKVQKAHSAALSDLTPAERKYVDDARRRHGYGA
jgi:hypothetical protein